MLNDGHWLSTKLKNHKWSTQVNTSQHKSTQVNTSQHKSTQVNTSHHVSQRDSWHEWSRQQHLSSPFSIYSSPSASNESPLRRPFWVVAHKTWLARYFFPSVSFIIFHLFLLRYTHIIYSCILFDLIWFDLIWFDLIWFDFILSYIILNCGTPLLLSHHPRYSLVPFSSLTVKCREMIHRCRSCEVRCERLGSLSLLLGIVQASIHLSSSSPPSLLLLSSSSPPPLLLLSPSSLPPLFLSSHDGFRSWSTHTHTHTEFRYEVREAREGERERRGEERRGEERRGEERRGEERRGEERGYLCFFFSFLLQPSEPLHASCQHKYPVNQLLGRTNWSATSSSWEKNVEIKMFFYYKLSHLPPSLSPSLTKQIHNKQLISC